MHKLKEMLMNELYDYEEKAKKMSGGTLAQSELEHIHKLSDTVKNLDKIEMLEDGYSEDGEYMGEGRIYGTTYGSSYARGRRGNVKRDSMGRYSRDGAKEHLIRKAEELLEMSTDPAECRKIEKFIRELEDG